MGGGHLFDMSRVDFLSFPIYGQNEERRNFGFGNREPTTLKNNYLYILAIIRNGPVILRAREGKSKKLK